MPGINEMLPPTGPPPRSSKKNPPLPSKNPTNQNELTNSPSKFIAPGPPGGGAPQKNISSPSTNNQTKITNPTGTSSSSILPQELIQNCVQLPEPTEAVEGYTDSLSHIVSNVNQQSYIALSRLAETMNGGDDYNKHVEILDYAKNSRQMYIRLLALVKWAQSSADHAEKCNRITTLLENHCWNFEDTANRLHDLKSRIVTQCRLPNFAVPAAIDVLTTGKFPRLPQCIHDMTIDGQTEDSENEEMEKNAGQQELENAETIRTIDTMIKHRLVMSRIPNEMYNFRIKTGTVQFHVKNKFLLLLTLSGDDMTKDCWRCLDLKILTKDPKVPDKSLVHANQVEILKQVIQNQLVEENRTSPLTQVYITLHTFCMRLELEVLFNHAYTLQQAEFNNVKVIEHDQGQSIKVSYWQSSFILDVDGKRNEIGSSSLNSYIGIRPSITISVPESSIVDNTTDLRIRHEPDLPEFQLMPTSVNLENIILDTITKRSKSILLRLRFLLQCLPNGCPTEILHDRDQTYCVLMLFGPETLSHEEVQIYVDQQTGALLVMNKYGLTIEQKDHFGVELERILKEKIQGGISPNNIDSSFLDEIRLRLVQTRVEKTIQQTGNTAMIITNYASGPVDDKNLLEYDFNEESDKKNSTIWFLPFKRYSSYCYTLKIVKNINDPCALSFYHYLCECRLKEHFDDTDVLKNFGKQASSETSANFTRNNNNRMSSYHIINVTQLYSSDRMQRGTKHQTSEVLNQINNNIHTAATTKNNIDLTDIGQTVQRSQFQDELAYLLTSSDTKIPFIHLCQELDKHGFVHTGVVEDGPENNPMGYCVRVLKIPGTDRLAPKSKRVLSDYLVDCVFRLQARFRGWMVDLFFNPEKIQSIQIALDQINSDMHNILPSTRCLDEMGRMTFPYNDHSIDNNLGKAAQRCIKEFQNQWLVLSRLYTLTDSLASLDVKHSKSEWDRRESVSTDDVQNPHYVPRFMIHQWNWKKLVLRYGPDMNFTCTAVATMNNLTLQVPDLAKRKNGEQETSITSTALGSSVNLHFARYGGDISSNPHNLMIYQLTQYLDESGSIQGLLVILDTTIRPMVSIARLPLTGNGLGNSGIMGTLQHHSRYHTAPQVNNPANGGGPNRVRSRLPQAHKQRQWQLIVRTYYYVKLIYSNKYVLDIDINHPNMVGIWDGSSSVFNVEENINNCEKVCGIANFLYSQQTDTCKRWKIGSVPFSASTDYTPGSGTISSDNAITLSHRMFDKLLQPVSQFMERVENLDGTQPPTIVTESPGVGPASFADTPQTPSSLSRYHTNFVAPQSAKLSALDQFLEASMLYKTAREMVKNMAVSTDNSQVFNVKQNDDAMHVLKFVAVPSKLGCEIQVNEKTQRSLNFKLVTQEEWEASAGSGDSSVEIEPLKPFRGRALEEYFNTHVVAPPFRHHALQSFITLLSLPRDVLNSIIKLIMLDLASRNPNNRTYATELGLRFKLKLCMTIPPDPYTMHPNVTQTLQPGRPGILKHEQTTTGQPNTRLLIFVQLDRIQSLMNVGCNEQSFALPILYEIQNHRTQLYDQMQQNQAIRLPQDSVLQIAFQDSKSLLEQFNQQCQQNLRNNGGGIIGECTLFDAVKYLITNLTIR